MILSKNRMLCRMLQSQMWICIPVAPWSHGR